MTHNIKEIKMKDNLIVEAVFYCGVVKDFDVSLMSRWCLKSIQSTRF